MITLEKLKKIIDENFRAPFLPEGFVTAKFVTARPNPFRPNPVPNDTLQVKIGPRDVWIERDGTISAAGTDVTKTVQEID